MLSTLAWAFVLLVSLNPLGAAAAPKHEVAFGAGLGRSFEDAVLNTPDDFSSSPGRPSRWATTAISTTAMPSACTSMAGPRSHQSCW